VLRLEPLEARVVPAGAVHFADPDLEQAVRAELGLPEATPITPADMASLAITLRSINHPLAVGRSRRLVVHRPRWRLGQLFALAVQRDAEAGFRLQLSS
jgi:hypothetical protein